MPDRIPYYKAYEIPCEIACCVSVCECLTVLLCNDVSITISNDHVALYFCLSEDGVDYRQCQVLLYRDCIRCCIGAL